MKQTEFFNNVYYFVGEDFISFDKFLMSPFFNTLQSTITVFRIIKKNHKLVNDRNYKDLKIAILKESSYKEIHLRKILSKLNELYVDYIKIKAYKSEQYYNEYLSSKYLLSIGNLNLLGKRVEILNGLLDSSDIIDGDVFLKLYDMNSLNYDIICLSDNNLNPLSKISKQKEYTLESSKNLFVYVIVKETINFLNYILQCNGVADKVFSVDLENIYKIMKTPEFKTYNELQITTINLFYKIYKLFKQPTNDKYYTSYKAYYNNVKHMYNIDFCKTSINIMLNFCNYRQRLKDNDRYYFKEGLKLQYDYFDNNYYLDKNTKYLNSVIYRNYVISCTNSGEKTLLGSLKENKKILLNPEDEISMKMFCAAHYYYLNGQYLLSITVAKSLDNPKVYFKFDVFILLLKSYYELNNIEGIEDTLHNYLYYINQGSFFTKFEKERYLFLHTCMRKFVTASINYEKNQDIIDFELLMEDIKSKDTFVMKTWLTDKVTKIIFEHNSIHTKKTRIR